MKFSIVAAAAVAIACVFQPVAAESEASIHLRVHAEKGNCYTAHCGSGQYCAWSQGWCRSPNRSKNECFNPATGEFQTGCSAGFKCKNGKCDYA